MLLYALLIIGGIQLCALSRRWTALPDERREPGESGAPTGAGRDPLA